MRYQPRYTLLYFGAHGSHAKVGPVKSQGGFLHVPSEVRGDEFSLAEKWRHAQCRLWYMAAARVVLGWGEESSCSRSQLYAIAATREVLEERCPIDLGD